MPAINVIDGLITFRIIKMLVTPWTQTKAFRLGIIDENGIPRKKVDDLKTAEEQGAYTILDRLVFKIKRILQNIPFVNRNLANFATALWLVKECYIQGEEPTEAHAQVLFEEASKLPLTTEKTELTLYNEQHWCFVLHHLLLQEDGAAVGGGAPSLGNGPAINSIPANRQGSGAVAGFKPEDIGRRKLVKKILRRRPPIGEPSNATSPLA